MGDKELLAVVGYLLNRQAHRRDRNVDDQIDFVDIVPLPRDAGGDIGLDLVVGGNDGIGLPKTLPPKSSAAICAAVTDA